MGRSRSPLVLVLTVLIVAGGLTVGCGVLSSGPTRDDRGRVIEAGDVAPFELIVGDCFNDPGLDQVRTVTVVPCDEPHDYEIYHRFELGDGPFPGGEIIEDRWIQECLAQFEPFVGLAFDESVLDMSAIFPTQKSWEELDDREILCSVTAVDGTPRTRTAQGSRI